MYDDTNTGTTFLYELARDRETSELVGYLKRGRKPVIRSRAAELLADFRDVSAQQEREEIIHGLITTVQHDDDDEVRARAIDALLRFGDDALSLVQLIGEAHESESHEIRQTIAEQLARIDADDIVPLFVDILAESQRWAIRRNTAWLLGHVVDDEPDEQVYDCLVDALDDEDGTTAKVAASTLADIGDKRLEKRLRLFIQDHEEGSQPHQRAEFILEKIGGNPESELVKNSVEYTYVRDPADYTKQKQQTSDSEED